MAKRFKKGKKAHMTLPVTVKSVDKENHSLVAIFSSQKEDRHGDIVMQDGWDLKNFKKNPVIINSHNYDDATEVIGKAVPSTLKVENGELTGTIVFAVNENPKAKTIFDLYAGGFLHAFSVGFIPKKFKEGDFFVIEESELLELSAVSVPANAYALAKAKGIKMDDDEGNPLLDIEDEDDETDEPIEEEETPEPVADEEEEEAPAAETDEEEEDEEEDVVDPEENLPEIPEEDEAETLSIKPEVMDPKQRILKVINKMESERTASLKKVHAIIQSLLEDGEKKTAMDPMTKEKIAKRKMNQAIRALIKAK